MSEHFDTYISTEESVISENSKIDRSKFNALIFDQFQSGLDAGKEMMKSASAGWYEKMAEIGCILQDMADFCCPEIKYLDDTVYNVL